MAAATTTTIAGILKRLYPQSTVPSLMFDGHPFFGMLPKSENFGGEDMRIAMTRAGTAGGSATFSTAQSNKEGAKHTGFNVTDRIDYSLWSISTQAKLASEINPGALVAAVKAEADAAFNTAHRSLSISMFRNGGGARGQVGSTSTTTLTLLDPEDIYMFEEGMYVETSTTDGTSGSVDAGSSTQITGVDYDAGTLTAAANWTAGGDFSDNDFLFRAGDFGATLLGLDSWLPGTAPTGGDSFYNVDRSVNPTKLAGVRYVAATGTDDTYSDALVNAGVKLSRHQSKADCAFVNPAQYLKILEEQGNKVRHTKTTARGAKGALANISFDGLELSTLCGTVKVIPDIDCPNHVAYMLQMDTWKLYTRGGCPRWLADDGNKMLRESSADAIEGRLGTYGALTCTKPGRNARIDLSALAA